MEILNFKKAPLSETLGFVSLIPSIRVLIAAILHKLSAEVVPICAFSQAHTAITLSEMTVSSHLLCSLAVPLFTSLFPDSPISLSFSSLCFASVGTTNEQLSCPDWMMYEIIRWDESVHNSKDVKWKSRERTQCRRGDTEMF